MIDSRLRNHFTRPEASDPVLFPRPLTFSLDETSESRLLNYGREVWAFAGERLLTAEEVPRKALLLLSGNASLHSTNTCSIDIFGRRELIGFAEAISRRPLCYSVVAESDCRLELIDRRRLLLAICDDIHLRNGLLFSLSAEVRALHGLFELL